MTTRPLVRMTVTGGTTGIDETEVTIGIGETEMPAIPTDGMVEIEKTAVAIPTAGMIGTGVASATDGMIGTEGIEMAIPLHVRKTVTGVTILRREGTTGSVAVETMILLHDGMTIGTDGKMAVRQRGRRTRAEKVSLRLI